jgi:hypothetical protein
MGTAKPINMQRQLGEDLVPPSRKCQSCLEEHFECKITCTIKQVWVGPADFKSCCQEIYLIDGLMKEKHNVASRGRSLYKDSLGQSLYKDSRGKDPERNVLAYGCPWNKAPKTIESRWGKHIWRSMQPSTWWSILILQQGWKRYKEPQRHKLVTPSVMTWCRYQDAPFQPIIGVLFTIGCQHR